MSPFCRSFQSFRTIKSGHEKRRYDLKDPDTGRNCGDFDTIDCNVLVSYGVLRPIRRGNNALFFAPLESSSPALAEFALEG